MLGGWGSGKEKGERERPCWCRHTPMVSLPIVTAWKVHSFIHTFTHSSQRPEVGWFIGNDLLAVCCFAD